MTSLDKTAEIIINKCLGIKKGEKVLIVSDETTFEIAEALFKKSSEKTETSQIRIKPTGQHGKEPDEIVAKAMKEADVVIAPTKYSLTHTKARKDASKKGTRVVTMPGITKEMFERAIDIKYEEMGKEIEKIAEKMRKCLKIKVKTNSGTDFWFENDGKRVINDDTGIFTKKGDYGNLPAGEVFVAPLEKTSNGVIIIDSMENLCKPKTKILVKKGLVQDVEKDSEFRKKLWKFKNARNIAEFGIGTNPKARIINKTLEDEKVRGTCHIAFGSSFAMKGKVKAEVHWDGIIIAPSIWFDDEKIMDNGVLLL